MGVGGEREKREQDAPTVDFSSTPKAPEALRPIGFGPQQAQSHQSKSDCGKSFEQAQG